MRRAIRRTSWLAVVSILSQLRPTSALAQGKPEEDEIEDVPAADPKPETPPAAPEPPQAPPGKAGDDEEIPEEGPSAPGKPADKKGAPSEDEAAEAEAEMTDEDLAELEGVDIARPPAKGKGAVVGVITDTKFDEPIIEGRVQVVGSKLETTTDIEGRFRLELPRGTYSIRVSYELHQPTRIDGVQVAAGKIVRIDAKLTPDESAVETIVVEEEADKTSLEGQTLERKRTATVSDGVGRAEIARTPDRNAAEAAQRVVGATIVGGRFVFVRGLGERYTNALLNGTPLPSPEPDRQTVPLDLFPSLVLDSVTITKQFSPDMPADFAGGSVRIHTREFPRQTLFQVSLSGGYNTEATFGERLSHRGSNTDWLGFDGGARELPEGIPDRKLDNTAPEADRITWGRRVNSYMSTIRRSTPPNHGVSVVAGDSFKVGQHQKLGMIAALTYGRSYQSREWTIRNYREILVDPQTSGLRVADNFRGTQDIETVRWGAFGSATYEPSPDHKLALTALRSQNADDIASDLEGTFEANPGVFRMTHLEYVSRAMNFGQLRGAHTLPSLNRAEIDWYGSIASATRDQPDTRDNRYVVLNRPMVGPGYAWSQGEDSGLHFFQEQSELTLSGGLDLTQPLTRSEEPETKLKFGGMVTMRGRDSSARRFSFEGPRIPPAEFTDASFCAGTSWAPACPDRLFRNDNIGPSGLMLNESTLRFDDYEAGLDVYAGYGMVDSQILEDLRVVGGVRVEVTDQRFSAWDPFDRANSTLSSGIESTDWLPALSVVFNASSKANTRFGISRTLARPQLREITPFLSSSYTADLPTQGNPDLKLTGILNGDLRFEYFPTLREVVAFSFFYKRFTDPIEEVILPASGTGILSYANADSADLIGTEIEARKALGFIGPALDDFVLIANFTLADSTVDLGRNAGIATRKSRPLSLQAPYVINVSLDYGNDETGTDARVLYNVYGARITAVGSRGIPDIYELPRHVVDATVAQKIAKHFEVKLAAQNLLAAPVVFAHLDAREYNVELQPDGTEIARPGGVDPVTRRYQPGTNFTLTATYTY